MKVEPIVGEHLERIVSEMKLGVGSDPLIALCTRADQSGTDASTIAESPEGRRLIPKLHRFGIENASKKLSRNIYSKNGELYISPYKEKQQQKEKQEEEEVAA